MPKKSYTYLEVDPYKIIEKGFHRDRDQVSESLFSLGNEYSGIRGFFEEGYSGKKLIGSYFNGIYDYALEETPNAYKGIVKRTHFTINSINWVKCSIIVDDEVLDLNISNFKDFYRELDFKNGLYTRSFTWITHLGELKIKFERLLNMTYCHQFLQKITFSSNTNIPVTLKMDLDNTILHWNSDCYWKRKYEFIDEDIYGLEAETLTTKQKLISAEIIDSPCEPVEKNTSDRYVSVKYNFVSTKKTSEFTRYVINIVDKFNKISDEELLYKAKDEVKNLKIKESNYLWQMDRLCFCVYLVHPVFINFMYKFIKITPLNIRIIPIGITVFFMIFVIVSFVASFILNKIPFLRKNVL